MNIQVQSKISLYPLQIRPDKRHFIVEESTTGEFYEMPKICIDAIEQINKGITLEQVEQALLKTYPADEVDVMSFAQQLVEFGLVKEIDGTELSIKKKSRRADGFGWISPKFGRIFFNKVTNKLYMTLLLVNILLVLSNPELLPNYKEIFLFDSMVLSILSYMVISLALIVIHEFGHILAIRSFDLPTKLAIGHRLLLIVFETDLSAAWKLAPRQRNTLYFAGMSFEQVIITIAFLLTMFIGDGNAIVTGVLAIVIFDIFIKTIYQCCFYMKTDCYYIIENISGSYNLMENGKQYLRKWLPFIKKDSTTQTFQDETLAVRLYSVFYVFGLFVTIVLFVSYFIPQAYYAYSQIFTNLLSSIKSPYFWDSLVLLGLTILMGGLLIVAMIKKRLEEKSE
ncbi:peptidase [Ornithinibacillus xuwenensis]|uniref:Peptidase n=1 Tax=Ornithinibacillus xuwenensis TaxID=3144668 RepID=A0ABU9XL97_9BACI